jgi:hypothetical protein
MDGLRTIARKPAFHFRPLEGFEFFKAVSMTVAAPLVVSCDTLSRAYTALTFAILIATVSSNHPQDYHQHIVLY